jgi:general secretion pathway protein F
VTAPRLRGALADATDAIARGERLSAALAQQGLATPVALRMVRVGEQSGALGAMLGEAARFHDDETQRLTDLVGRLVNPVLMLVMGTVIGSIVVLLYLPIFQLAEQVQ